MSVADRSNKRMKGEDGPMGTGPPPPDGYGQPGRYPQYGGPGGPSYMWQQGHPPPSHTAWGHGSSAGAPPPGTMYAQRGGPSMTPDRAGYGSAYHRGPPPPNSGPPLPVGGTRRGGKPPSGPLPPSMNTAKGSDGPPTEAPPPQDGSGLPPPHSGYQGNYYPPPQAAYGSNPYQNGPPPPMHHSPPPPAYGNPPSHQQSSNMYGNSPTRPNPHQSPPRSSPELLGGGTYSQTTTSGTDAPDFDNLFSPRAIGGSPLDDDGNSSVVTVGGGANSKDKGRGSYKCGRCGVPKKGHVCPYQPKLTRKVGEPLPEMRSAAIQVEMDEFMTLRRLNLKIQGFPESYASEPYGEDMVVGEPHQQSSPSQQQQGDVSNTVKNGSNPPTSSHDPVAGVLGSPIRSSPITEDPITGAA
mmetsp:Transcript_36815/g.41425  ORF Transcript_36815/g.41425 Transcript_36815/m.41425 type:complete len:409 (+) Transcript_36815:271-1497(+)